MVTSIFWDAKDMTMKLTIQQDIPNSKASDITVSFAKHFVDADFVGLREMLSEEVFIVLYNRETKYGVDAVLGYFRDWQERVGDTFECEVRWSAQYSRPEIYFSSEKFKQAYILGIGNGKIVRILLMPRSFSSVGFSIDETPYNEGFIEANAPKEIEPLHNRAFCPICGKTSELLNWRKGIIFKQGAYWDKKTGMFVNASICPECNIVCEVSPDKSEKHILTMTREQQDQADAKMTEEERAQYVDNTLGNKKPLFKNCLKSRTNELAKFGEAFQGVLDKIVDGDSIESIFNHLDKLTLKEKVLNLHIASENTNDIGDESYFYVIDKDGDRDYKVYKHLKVEPSAEAAWQIYLLHNARTVMPVFWHGGYILRDYIFDEASLNDYVPLECYDISGLSRENLLLPEVIMSVDGKSANVYCTYWNDWKGLVRDRLHITFLRNGKVKLTEIEPLCLFEYNCGICF